MPVKTAKPPKGLRPYLDHGLDISFSPGDTEGTAECPMCGDDRGKFTINCETSKAQCWSCQGDDFKNDSTFLRWLWSISDKHTDSEDYDSLLKDRQLLYKDTLFNWGVCKSYLIDNCWLIPGYNEKGVLQQLYRYEAPKAGGKPTLLSTSGIEHKLFGMTQFNPEAERVFICEGPWDGMALSEALKNHDEYKDNCTVLSIPGCSVFKEGWRTLLSGKDVVLMFDNDLPKKQKNGKVSIPAATTGLKKIGNLLLSASRPPANISYLRWNPKRKPKEVMYNIDLPSGYDVRDFLCQ